MAAEWYQAPTFYFTSPYALIGAHDDVAIPPGCQVLDYELEVAVVVGRDGASLSPEQAREHVFGYTVLNDWSARDLQRREMNVDLGPAKGKDFATTLGPWLVTADELEPYRDAAGFLALDLRASVNGTLTGQDLLSNMGWPFEELISYASRGARVRAGDVLGSGTCGNGGCLAELWGRSGKSTRRRCAPGTSWNWPSKASARYATASSKALRFHRCAKHEPVLLPGPGSAGSPGPASGRGGQPMSASQGLDVSVPSAGGGGRRRLRLHPARRHLDDQQHRVHRRR